MKTILADYERYEAPFGRHGVRLVPRGEIETRAQHWSSHRQVA